MGQALCHRLILLWIISCNFYNNLIIIDLQIVPLLQFQNRKADGLAQAHTVKGRARTQALAGYLVPRYPTAQQITTWKRNVIILKPFVKMFYNR